MFKYVKRGLTMYSTLTTMGLSSSVTDHVSLVMSHLWRKNANQEGALE